MAKTTTTPAKRTLAQALRADRRARERGIEASTLTADERRELLTQLNKISAKSAPTMEAAESDLLTMLFIAASEFARKYYPNTTQGSIFFYQDGEKKNEPGHSVSIPFPLVKSAE